jgi:hypothetical protein
MNLHYIKTGLAVMAVAIVTYIFFPVTASHNQSLSQTAQTTAAAGQKSVSQSATNNDKSRRTETAKQKHIKKKSSRKSESLAKGTSQQIAPETTLRKTETARGRSGPPSKMYGGL